MIRIPTSYSTEVYCSLQVEALHNWPGCPFGEVDYLRDLHRHVFFIKAYMPVSHSDRDVEFIMLKHKIQQYLTTKYTSPTHNMLVFGAMSCELIARELTVEFGLSKCDVSEDNENGAIVVARAGCWMA